MFGSRNPYRLFLEVIGRLKPNATMEQARADIALIARQMDREFPTPLYAVHRSSKVRVESLQDQLAGASKTAIWVLMGAVMLILAIVCANMANLFLARSAGRQREIAIRAAMGASRWRLVRLLLIESIGLAALGGALGALLMRWSMPALQFLVPATIASRIPIDWRVVVFAALCSMATGLLFGVAPSLAASRLDLNRSLKEAGSQSGGQESRSRMRNGLVVAQVGLCVILLIGAGLLIRSFVAVLSVNPGFNPHNVLLADVALAPPQLYGPAQQTQFYDRLLGEAQRLPGVETAALTDATPLVPFQELDSGLKPEGAAAGEEAPVVVTTASADYFKALRIPLLAGRTFDVRDRGSKPTVAVVNQMLARLLFQDRNPVGRRINGPLTIVGVVGDIRHRALDDRVWPEIFFPYAQYPSAWMSIVLRTSGDPSALAPSVQRIVHAIDRSQPVFDVTSLETRFSASVAERRRRALLLGAFAAIALLIAVIGVYGVVSYSVTRRTHEIGVRMALGATGSNVLRLVLGEGLRMALIGVAIGGCGALALTRTLQSFLFGVTARDVTTMAVATVTLLAAACVASYIPARRATRIEPMAALRDE